MRNWVVIKGADLLIYREYREVIFRDLTERDSITACHTSELMLESRNLHKKIIVTYKNSLRCVR